jgi:hypothetical protein
MKRFLFALSTVVKRLLASQHAAKQKE